MNNGVQEHYDNDHHMICRRRKPSLRASCRPSLYHLSVGQSNSVVDLPDHLGPGARRLSYETEVFGDWIDAVADRETVFDHREHVHH